MCTLSDVELVWHTMYLKHYPIACIQQYSMQKHVHSVSKQSSGVNKKVVL